jgi:two-component system, NtrC family, sensor histidine kinase KinB
MDSKTALSTINNALPQERRVSLPVHETLAQLAARISPEVAQELFGLELGDVKSALEYAAMLSHQVDQVARGGSRPLQETVDLDLKKILVVDDIEENRFLMKYMFRGTGFNLLLAADANEALQIARVERPVLIISDIQMPFMNGLELLQALKADDQTKNIAVILVTAHHHESKEVSEGLTLGADDYIHRPFMRDEFVSRVEAVLRVKRAEAETQQQARLVARRNKGLRLVNELSLAINSSLDLKEIFTFSMQKLSQMFEAEIVALLLLNQDKQNLVINVASHLGKQLSITLDYIPLDGTASAFEEQVSELVFTVLAENYATLELTPTPETPSLIKSIAMTSKDQTVGAIAIVNRRWHAFDEADEVLLRSAASIIAVAIENAHLLESTQQQVDDLIALTEIGRALTSTLDLALILKQTTLLMQRSFQAEAASLWLLDETKTSLVLIAYSGIEAGVVTNLRLPIETGIAGYVARTGNSYISADVSTDHHYFDYLAQVSHYKARSILCVPVQVRGETIGVMDALHQRPNWFDQTHLRLSYPVASFVGIAVENARLFNEVQDFSRHLEQMVAERTQELAEEKEKTEAILINMADGLLVLDPDHCILTANRAAEKMLDFQLSELSGQAIGLKQLENPLWRCLQDITGNSETTVSTLVDVRTPHSETMLAIQAHSARIKNQAGQNLGTVIVLRDITVLKEMERMKARFIAGVTHELKTPLAIIALHSRNLSNYFDRLSEAKRGDLIRSIQSQVSLLERLIGDILQLSRLDGGAQEMKFQPLDLVLLVDLIVSQAQPLAETKRVVLEWQKPAAPVMIQSDPDQLERVVRNLIDNAIKYTLPGGLVQVHALTESINGRALATIKVMDTGIGIPDEHQAKIFERFYRVDPSHTIPGTGLGLSIVQEVVHAHGGTVQLKSTPGVGTTFVVTLPA